MFVLPCRQIYNDATQLVQVFRHFRNQLDSSEFDQSDNEGSLHSTLVDVSEYILVLFIRVVPINVTTTTLYLIAQIHSVRNLMGKILMDIILSRLY